jgi:GTP:adenosylcobinamide-phosphate guanylyltransferase
MPDAVVLAGGTESGELYEATGMAYRPLLEVGGTTIIMRVLAALRGASEVGDITLVAPEEVQRTVTNEALDMRVTAGESFLDNLVKGVTATRADARRLLVITGDLPLITSQALCDLCRQAEANPVDVVYPIIPKEACERAFPGGKRTYVKLREGVFTGGNAMVLSRDFVLQQQELIHRLFEMRKNPLKLATLFGLKFILGLATGRLTLAGLEARAGRIIGGRVAAVISAYPELGFDVDKLVDLEVAQRAAHNTIR